LTAATDSTGEIDMLETFKTTAMMMQKVRVDGDKVYMTIRTQAGAEQEVEGGVKYTLNGETIKGDDLTGTWKYKDGKIIVEANNAILTYTKA
jgi:hypothetical protein